MSEPLLQHTQTLTKSSQTVDFSITSLVLFTLDLQIGKGMLHDHFRDIRISDVSGLSCTLPALGGDRLLCT